MPRKPKPASPDKGHGGAAAKRKKSAAPKASAKAPKKPEGGTKAKAKAKRPAKPKTAPATVATSPEAFEAPAAETSGKHPGGRPTDYRPEYARMARVMCRNGATDAELAEAFDVNTTTIWRWQAQHEEFCNALKVQKGEYDERVKRGLAQRAAGYSYNAVKIFMPAGAKAPVYAEYVEHVPPDPGAAKIWLCNRQPEEWRDRKELTGKDGAPLVPVLNVMYGDGSSGQSQPAS